MSARHLPPTVFTLYPRHLALFLNNFIFEEHTLYYYLGKLVSVIISNYFFNKNNILLRPSTLVLKGR